MNWTLALAIIAASLVGMLVGATLTIAIQQQALVVPSSGLVLGVGIGVYSDAACTQNLTSITWGNIWPGNSSTRTCYIKNTGNSQITLTITTQDWNPTGINSNISLSCDREGAVIGPGQVVFTTLTLSVLPNAAGTTFTFNIKVTGSG